jgi:hypothetical protein
MFLFFKSLTTSLRLQWVKKKRKEKKRKEKKRKKKAIPLEAWTAPKGSRKLMILDFKTICT